jgi:hypothetical protein
MTGLHPERNFNNIKNLLQRMHGHNADIDLKYHIVFKSNEPEVGQEEVLAPNMKERLQATDMDSVNFFSYESSFLRRYGNAHQRHHPASLTIQQEPLREFVNQEGILDSDFVLKTRTDIHIDDHFIDMFLDKNFYDSLKTTGGPYTVPGFEYKIWNAFISPDFVLEFTDYFFLARVKELKQTLVQGHEESEYLWHHPVNSTEQIFPEKLQFIKPLLPILERAGATSVHSDFYWDIVNDNFSIAYYGVGNCQKDRPVLDRNKK